MFWDRSANGDRSPVRDRIEAVLSRAGLLVFALAFILAVHVAPAAAHAVPAYGDLVQGAHGAPVHAAQLLSPLGAGAVAQIETIRRMPRSYAVRTTNTQFAVATGKPTIPAEIVANLPPVAVQLRMADARRMGAPVRAPPMTICIL